MALLVKLGFLGIRAGTKMLSKRVKKEAQRHPTFKQFCISSAQSYQSLLTKTNVSILSNVKITKSKPLSETEAVEMGADMIAEIMVWSAAALQVVALYYYDRNKKDDKYLAFNEQFDNIQQNYDLLKEKLDALEQELVTVKEYAAITADDDG
eukprot:CAMPEP_0197056278 /NCGR_PEP_ID=MMETSP1384-20130603/81694_1 /TAXON_ID=29189 /ORGANISM="Ammonia sp." /LENGTH=151 /DNA_ID=CAMNT_0042490193 /DNA_START=85 /DNA_END=536 /DNA_ORIENTATION=+